ncbi:MAG: hypothetical protein LBC35_05790 [Coriobacteriales bacterium]|jgi:hypothetical protein|nr:hypothetical protein [Coriobacteriales bacterium]
MIVRVQKLQAQAMKACAVFVVAVSLIVAGGLSAFADSTGFMVKDQPAAIPYGVSIQDYLNADAALQSDSTIFDHVPTDFDGESYAFAFGTDDAYLTAYPPASTSSQPSSVTLKISYGSEDTGDLLATDEGTITLPIGAISQLDEPLWTIEDEQPELINADQLASLASSQVDSNSDILRFSYSPSITYDDGIPVVEALNPDTPPQTSGYIYAQFQQDYTTTDDVTYYAGQVVQLPLFLDVELPAISDVVLNYTGEIDYSGVHTSFAELTFSVSDDVQSAPTVKLTIENDENSPYPLQPSGGVYSFKFVDTVSTDNQDTSYTFSDILLSAGDGANTATCLLYDDQDNPAAHFRVLEQDSDSGSAVDFPLETAVPLLVNAALDRVAFRVQDDTVDHDGYFNAATLGFSLTPSSVANYKSGAELFFLGSSIPSSNPLHVGLGQQPTLVDGTYTDSITLQEGIYTVPLLPSYVGKSKASNEWTTPANDAFIPLTSDVSTSVLGRFIIDTTNPVFSYAQLLQDSGGVAPSSPAINHKLDGTDYAGYVFAHDLALTSQIGDELSGLDTQNVSLSIGGQTILSGSVDFVAGSEQGDATEFDQPLNGSLFWTPQQDTLIKLGNPLAPTSYGASSAPAGASARSAVPAKLEALSTPSTVERLAAPSQLFKISDPAALNESNRLFGPDTSGGSSGGSHLISELASAPTDPVLINLADMAGNTTSPELTIIDNAAAAVKGIYSDSAAPVIGVSFDNDEVHSGNYYAAPRTASITITEASFFATQASTDKAVGIAELESNGRATTYNPTAFTNPTGDDLTWVLDVPCPSDGVYALSAQFTDLAGKTSNTYDSGVFIIDTIAPTISLSFDNNDAANGNYYKDVRTATIEVTEVNFDPSLVVVTATATDASGAAVSAPGISGWEPSATKQNTYTTTVAFTSELHYTLSIEAADPADNIATSQSEPEFIIDLTPPQIQISGVADQTAYNDAIQPVVAFSDTNFDPLLSDVQITGSTSSAAYFDNSETEDDTSRTLAFADLPYELSYDDVYTLAATVIDKAGNETEQQLTYSVNRFGSNYELADSCSHIPGTYLAAPLEVLIYETNVSGLVASSVSVSKDDQLNLLASGEDYDFQDVSGGSAWARYAYTIPAENFATDGFYRILLSSQDAAGNLSENHMDAKNVDRSAPFHVTFAVDMTNPRAYIQGVVTGQSYNEPSKPVEFFIDDNIALESATLYVDDVSVSSWNESQLAAAAVNSDETKLTYDLAGKSEPQNIRIVALDKAGNSVSATADEVLITNEFLIYALSTPLGKIGAVSIVALVLIALGLGAFFFIKRRRQRVEQDSEGELVDGLPVA